MPATTLIQRCRCVSIVRRGESPNLYLRYVPSWGERRGKVTLESCCNSDIKHARRKAEERANEIEQVRPLAGKRTAVGEAMSDAISTLSMGGEKHREDLKGSARRFIEWLIEHEKKDVVYWDEITPELVLQYIGELDKQGYARQTIAHRFCVITLTARHLYQLNSRQYQLISVRHRALSKKRRGAAPKKKFLKRTGLQRLLAIARGETAAARMDRRKHPTAPQAELAVLLCGFCGLRVTEAARLRTCDIDAGRATLVIEQGKNHYSEREIPIPGWIARRVLELAGGRTHLFPNATDTGPQDAKEALCKRIRSLLKRAGYKGICPRNLRTSFANLAEQCDVGERALKVYMGHSTLGDMQAERYVEFKQVEVLRRRVLSLIHPEPFELYRLGNGTNLGQLKEKAPLGRVLSLVV